MHAEEGLSWKYIMKNNIGVLRYIDLFIFQIYIMFISGDINIRKENQSV